MAWNQSGGNRPGGATPPGLDDLLRRLNAVFGDGGGGMHPARLAGWLVAMVATLWCLLGVYQVGPAEQAAVFRLGRLLAVHDAGLYWSPPFVDVVRRFSLSRLEQASVATSVVTADTDIASVSLTVDYRIADAQDYLLRAADPESLLMHATESALHRAAAGRSMEQLLASDHAGLAADVQRLLQAELEHYQAGLAVTRVSLVDVLPPPQVKAAFDDVAQAREDSARAQSEAEKQVAGLVPAAQTKAASLLADADAYRRETVDRARADAARFAGILAEYRRAPAVTRDRLYYETMESVLQKTRAMIVDGHGKEEFSLPLDRLVLPPALPEKSPAPAEVKK
jgi:membrane protease subunit HflK